MENKINFKFKGDKIDEFKSVISDLGKINKKMKMKLDDDNFILYSVATVGEGASSNPTVVALKSYSFRNDHFLDLQKYDEDEEESVQIDWVIGNSSVLTKKMSFLRGDVDIKGRFDLRKVNELNYALNVNISDGKFKFSLVGDDHTEVRNMTLDQLNQITDKSLSVVSFKIPTEEFISARSASNIDGDEIVSIELKNNKVYFKQDNWELLVGQCVFEGSKKISFNKKYLKSINPKLDTIEFTIFNTFLLTKENDQIFMISYEQNFG